jgi:hypothetical protein
MAAAKVAVSQTIPNTAWTWRLSGSCRHPIIAGTRSNADPPITAVPANRCSSKAHYPSAKAIERTVAAARAAGIEPHGLEVSRDGNIRILPATHTANDLFSKWESKL